jgi:hypothetical protein
MKRPIEFNWFSQAQPPPPPGPDIDGALKSNLPQSKSERRKIFDEVAGAITKAKREFKGNARHDVVKATKSSHIYLNSVAILTGSQGSGKTFCALAESLIVCRATRNTHMLIFIKKKAYDPTVEYIKPLIEQTGCRFVEIGYDEAQTFVEMIFHYKSLYNKVKRAIAYKHSGQPMDQLEEDLRDATDQEVKRMFEVLAVQDLKYDWLNTIICFDDSGNSGLFKNPDSYFNNRLKLCRDDNAIYFLTIHGIVQLSPSIKQNAATIFVFRGLSSERLSVIWRQMNIPLDWNEFKGAYRAISYTQGARMMVVDNITGLDPKIE